MTYAHTRFDVDGRTDGDGWKDGQADGWTYGQTNRWERMDGHMHGR